MKHFRLSWKMRIAIMLSAGWFLFWMYAGWTEGYPGFGFACGALPLIVFWWLWMGLKSPKRDGDAEFKAYLKSVKKISVSEKREYDRLEYPPRKRPFLKIDEHRMDIINLSEKGLKLQNDKEIEIKPFLNGEVTLLCGKKIRVDGNVSWSLNREVGLLITDIPQALIAEERAFLKKKYPAAMKLQK